LLVSGEVAEDPVVTRNGDVFERRLVEKYIAANGVDPVTKTPLTKEELISIKGKCPQKLLTSHARAERKILWNPNNQP
jgi:hypothetical protein